MAIVTRDFVFIHVPRTGGTSTRSAIFNRYLDAIDSAGGEYRKDHCGVSIPPEQHIGASKLERRDPKYLEARFVGFVRHPVTWYCPMWAWAKKTNFAAKIHCDPFAERHWLAAVWDDALAGFIDNVLAMQVPRAWVVFHEKLSRSDGSMCEYGRYENLHADLFRLTGCQIESRIRRSDENKKISTYQREAVSRLERETVKKFYGTFA